MANALLHFVSHYGYVAVAIIVALEGLGLPLPGETALVTAAAVAASGRLLIAGVIAAATAGAILGGCGGYWIGHVGGIALLHRHGRWIHLDEARLQRAQRFFQRYGALTVFVARFVALLRIAVGLLAGVVAMPFGRFFLFNAAGGAAWSLVFGLVGYAFGRNLPRLEHNLGRASMATALLVSLVVVIVIVSRIMVRRRDVLWLDAQRVWDWTCERLHLPWHHDPGGLRPGEYLALHLAAGFVVSVAVASVFSQFGLGVITGGPLVRFDAALAQRLHDTQTPLGLAVWSAVSRLGRSAVVGAIFAAAALLFATQRNWLPFWTWAAAFAGATALEKLVKQLIERPRPAFAPAPATHSYSFPSGHTTHAIVSYGLLAYFILRLVRPAWGRAIVIVAVVALVLAVGFSRLYLGAHYFSDVLGGYATGAVWLFTCITGLEVARRPA